MTQSAESLISIDPDDAEIWPPDPSDSGVGVRDRLSELRTVNPRSYSAADIAFLARIASLEERAMDRIRTKYFGKPARAHIPPGFNQLPR